MSAEQEDFATASAPAEGRWEFNAEVCRRFDEMLDRSIPNLKDMRRVVTEAAVYFTEGARSRVEVPTIMDLGASRGSGLSPIVAQLGVSARYVACDISEPMLEACGDRFPAMIQQGVLEVRHHDLRNGVPHLLVPAAAILSVLTLQFVPIEYRPALLREVQEALLPGGAFIIVEKVLGGTAEADALLTGLYHDLKRGNGYSVEAVERKALSLEGVLVPLTAAFNEELLRGAGFDVIEVVWAWGPFRCWIALKR